MRFSTFLVLVAVAAMLAACQPDGRAKAPGTTVRTVTVAESDYASSITLTGEIKPRLQSDLSFRVSGRITGRRVDVGAHVAAGQVLAEIDPKEQQATLAAAQAAVESAEAQLRLATANFDRQKALMDRGFTTRKAHDQAEETFRTAQGSLDVARAQLGTARDQLSYTVLRATSAGIITARHVETGQVVQAAQAVFTIAQDGARDAVFNVHETLLTSEQRPDRKVEIVLLADPRVTASGTVREIAPSLTAATGTVLVKIGLDEQAQSMPLGAAVKGIGRFNAQPVIVLPWQALSSQGGKPAVWIVDPHSSAVTLQPVTIARYDSNQVVIRDGLVSGQVVVTAGAQLLRPGQVVALAEGIRP